MLLEHGARTTISAGGLVGYDVSPDGTQVVATREQSLPTGISYDPTLLVIDTTTLQRMVLARVGPKEAFNGPIKWSPDGTHLAYNFVRYRVNPAMTHPGPTPELQTICVLAVHGGPPQCFPELSPVFDFDWVPDGRGLVITGPGPNPMRVLDWTTGHVSTLVELDDAALRKALALDNVGEAIQFLGPAWSSSGKLLAAWVNVRRGTVPAIFTNSGRLLHVGRRVMGNAFKFMWWPDRDVLVYTPGFSVTDRNAWTLRALNARSGRETIIARRPPRPLTNDFLISPSGRWVALLRSWGSASVGIQFMDLTRDDGRRQLRWSSEASFADWGPA